MPSSQLEKRFGLDGSCHVVLGAAGLIGRAVVQSLVDCSGQVVAIDPSPKVKELDGENVSSHSEDFTDEAKMIQFFKDLEKRSSEFTSWSFINCAYPRTENWSTLNFENVDLNTWNSNVEKQLGLTFSFSKQAVAFLEKTRGGSIVNFGSIYGKFGPQYDIYKDTPMSMPAPYAAVKAAVEGLTRMIATRYGSKGIRANTICPGGVENQQPESFIKAYSKKTPLGRMAQPQEIADVVAFLVGPGGRYISGQSLLVDGGWSAW